MWVTYFLKKLHDKWKHLELNQYTKKLSYNIQFHFVKNKNFGFEVTSICQKGAVMYCTVDGCK